MRSICTVAITSISPYHFYLGLYEWTREESLSEITAAEFVDLPLADPTSSETTSSSSSANEEFGPDDPEALSLPLLQRFYLRVSIQLRDARVRNFSIKYCIICYSTRNAYSFNCSCG